MGFQECGARKFVHFIAPLAQFKFTFHMAGEFSAREREYGSRYYDAPRASCRRARGSHSMCYTVATLFKILLMWVTSEIR